jgi:hypothetical protein
MDNQYDSEPDNSPDEQNYCDLWNFPTLGNLLCRKTFGKKY